MKAIFNLLIFITVLLPLTALSQTMSKSVSPLFWQLEHNGKTSYAFGSIHLAEKDSYPLPDVVMKGFAQTDALVVEVDINKISATQMNTLLSKYGMEPGKPLKRYLSLASAKKYDDFCQNKRLPCQQFSAFKPWLVSVTLMSMQSMMSGYSADLGIDKYFLEQAKDKPIIELETVTEQLSMFSNLSDKLQVEMLLQSISTGPDELKNLIGHWYKGDETALIKLFQKTTDSSLEDEFFEQLLLKRNIKMSEKLQALLKSGQRLFIVIGTGHLVGEQNVLALLEKKGVKVTPVEYKPAL